MNPNKSKKSLKDSRGSGLKHEKYACNGGGELRSKIQGRAIGKTRRSLRDESQYLKTAGHHRTSYTLDFKELLAEDFVKKKKKKNQRQKRQESLSNIKQKHKFEEIRFKTGISDGNDEGEITCSSFDEQEKSDICLIWRKVNGVNGKPRIKEFSQNDEISRLSISQHSYPNIIFGENEFPEFSLGQLETNNQEVEVSSQKEKNENSKINPQYNPFIGNENLFFWSQEENSNAPNEFTQESKELQETLDFFSGVLNALGPDFQTDTDFYSDSKTRFQKAISALYFEQ